MVETAAAKPAAPAATGKKPASTKKPQRRNYNLGSGVYRFSRTRMYHKKALWKFMGKITPKTPRPKSKTTIEKKIGGEKNGGTRTVYLKKRTKSYPTANKVRKHPSKTYFCQHKRKFRASLKPGAIVILLAGLHKGKRAVLLKNMASGLLLVSGPFTLNGVPLRRIHPNYVVATSTQIDMSDVKLPAHINDRYFKRVKAKKAKKGDGEIFAAKKEMYKPSEQRKTDQKDLDKQVLRAIKKHEHGTLLRKYLCTMFALRSSQYPHRMKF